MQLPSEHPFVVFKYCPRCGENGFTSVSIKSMKCPVCGLEWFYNPAPAVMAIIPNSKGEILFSKRKYDPGAAMLDLPGGFVDINETSEEALIREVEEETGLVVQYFEYLFSLPNQYFYNDLLYYTLDNVFLCSIENFDQMKPDDDVSELLFLEVQKIALRQIALFSVRNLVGKIQKEEKLKQKIFRR
ncbi:MAG TPA: NUDIX domain-containing protein [Bacteroidales bacterium]|nr:NUDIX domain-containing protein [Bacteroidales bacterium]